MDEMQNYVTFTMINFKIVPYFDDITARCLKNAYS